MNLSRRDFIRLSSLAGVSLALETGCVDRSSGEPLEPNEWLVVHPTGKIELWIGRMEMGQGIRTGLALIVAEELDVDPRVLHLKTPPVEGFFSHGTLLHTGSSSSTSGMWLRMRRTGAMARQLLTKAAARKWGVGIGSCRAENGRVHHDATGRSLEYGELATLASREKIPMPPIYKEPSEFRWMGRPMPRLEGPDIVTGRQRFGGDIRLEGQRFAVVARAPVSGEKLDRSGQKRALEVDGVEEVVRLWDSIAVIADSTWSAMEGRDALRARWRPGPASKFSTDRLQEELEKALAAPTASAWRPDFDSPRTVVVRTEGDAAAALADAGRILERRYSTPFHAHVPMETRNALVRLGVDRCDIWCGTQHPNDTRRQVAEFLEFSPDQVALHLQPMGGAFGQKEKPGFIVEAVAVARASGGGPVQVFWPREDDLAFDQYHPPSRHRMHGSVDERGRITAWRHRVAAPSIEKLWPFGRKHPELVPKAETSGAWNLPYGPENLLVEYVDPSNPIMLGFWRGVEIVPSAFAVECFADELAEAGGTDPLEFRLRNLGVHCFGTTPLEDEPPFEVARLARVLEIAGERSGWGTPMPPGSGRGLAGLVFDGRTACASVAEVSIKGRELSIDRFVTVIDCGFVVNPLGVAGNAESAITWGLSALFSEITFQEGRVRETSHVDYPILRFPEMPRVEVYTVPSEEQPSGTGEIPVPTVAPAVANAIYAATGRRIRSLPIRPSDFAGEGPA